MIRRHGKILTQNRARENWTIRFMILKFFSEEIEFDI
jgi:hypothetical protein